ncbi:hypothetical protein AN958_03251 [Leucoagaricus sp. SymC.cos]|nr:hypothetical protein AN958_03251 [Leucoagaricus sp. SymC.cos]
MSTRAKDCLEDDCIFSRRHSHTTSSCRSTCKRLMALPVRNPIRISDTVCPNCMAKAQPSLTLNCQSPA